MDPEAADRTAAASTWRQDIGVVIRDARRRRGLEIEDVAERLRLRRSFVEALEEGRGNEHMDESYEWSHIKAIAGLLDLDPEGPR
jgi:cytoskeleton protein RodZ